MLSSPCCLQYTAVLLLLTLELDAFEQEACEQRAMLNEEYDCGEMPGEAWQNRRREPVGFRLTCVHLPFVKPT